jgi:hypothetical protein
VFSRGSYIAVVALFSGAMSENPCETSLELKPGQGEFAENAI